MNFRFLLHLNVCLFYFLLRPDVQEKEKQLNLKLGIKQKPVRVSPSLVCSPRGRSQTETRMLVSSILFGFITLVLCLWFAPSHRLLLCSTVEIPPIQIRSESDTRWKVSFSFLNCVLVAASENRKLLSRCFKWNSLYNLCLSSTNAIDKTFRIW